VSDDTEKLTEEEVDAADAEALPDREAMSLLRPPVEPLPPFYSIEPPPPEEA